MYVRSARAHLAAHDLPAAGPTGNKTHAARRIASHRVAYLAATGLRRAARPATLAPSNLCALIYAVRGRTDGQRSSGQWEFRMFDRRRSRPLPASFVRIPVRCRRADRARRRTFVRLASNFPRPSHLFGGRASALLGSAEQAANERRSLSAVACNADAAGRRNVLASMQPELCPLSNATHFRHTLVCELFLLDLCGSYLARFCLRAGRSVGQPAAGSS